MGEIILEGKRKEKLLKDCEVMIALTSTTGPAGFLPELAKFLKETVVLDKEQLKDNEAFTKMLRGAVDSCVFYEFEFHHLADKLWNLFEEITTDKEIGE